MSLTTYIDTIWHADSLHTVMTTWYRTDNLTLLSRRDYNFRHNFTWKRVLKVKSPAGKELSQYDMHTYINIYTQSGTELFNLMLTNIID